MCLVRYRVLCFTDGSNIFQLSVLPSWLQGLIDILRETFKKLSIVDLKVLQVFKGDKLLRWLVEAEVVLEEGNEVFGNASQVMVDVLVRDEGQHRQDCPVTLLQKSFVYNVHFYVFGPSEPVDEVVIHHLGKSNQRVALLELKFAVMDVLEQQSQRPVFDLVVQRLGGVRKDVD